MKLFKLPWYYIILIAIGLFVLANVGAESKDGLDGLAYAPFILISFLIGIYGFGKMIFSIFEKIFIEPKSENLDISPAVKEEKNKEDSSLLTDSSKQ